jgi:hypothetical protein
MDAVLFLSLSSNLGRLSVQHAEFLVRSSFSQLM